MLTLRVMEAADVAVIHRWPAYPPEFDELDYALRDDGWIAEFRDKPDCRMYVAKQDDELVAFTMLARTGNAEAEFRIALRADWIARGLGKTLTAATLEKGFAELQLARIYLIVRKNNLRAIRLYEVLGFASCGECEKNANNTLTSFFEMAIARDL